MFTHCKNWSIISPVKFFSVLLLIFCSIFSVPAQTIDLAGVEAEDEFRTGVMLFNSGYYNQAHMRFEKALSIKPTNRLYRFWLGRSLLQNGYHAAAVEVWLRLVEEGYKADFLQSRVDFLNRIYYSADETYRKRNFVISHTLYGIPKRGRRLFSAPVSVAADSYGGLLVPSFLTSEVVRFNANGLETARVKSGYRGFYKPFDVLPTENPNIFWLTEFGADRVVKVNRFGIETAAFGTKGRGDDQFMGPQFLAADSDGFLYVTDAGNKKVSKWTADGQFVLAFGKNNYPFPGFTMPSGIAVFGNSVYVADQRAKTVYVFDGSGNFIEALSDPRLKGPEGLFNWNERELLLADGEMIFSLDPRRKTFEMLTDAGSAGKRVTKAIGDVNGNLISVDVEENRIDFFCDVNSLYAGFDAEIASINTLDFPKIEMVVSVNNSLGEPFVGLDGTNFTVYEESVPVAKRVSVFSADAAEEMTVSVLVDRNLDGKKYASVFEYLAAELFQRSGYRDRFFLLGAEEKPVRLDEIVSPDSDSLDDVKKFVSRMAGENQPEPTSRKLDVCLREAMAQLETASTRKAVIYITNNRHSDTRDFALYDTHRLTEYASANRIGLYIIAIDPDGKEPTSTMHTLAEESGGLALSYDDPSGIKKIVDHIKQKRTGFYLLRYTSVLDGDYGRRYVPCAVELNHLSRTGWAESGYFSPRDF